MFDVSKTPENGLNSAKLTHTFSAKAIELKASPLSVLDSLAMLAACAIRA
jgi:hypothetical protein